MDCHVCGSHAVEEFEAYCRLPRVTSDCHAWPAGGRLGACRACGCIQKAIDAKWQGEIGEIYGTYDIYHQSGGTEQQIFDPSGQAASRSARLSQRLLGELKLPASGRLLDLGCGNGAFLRAFQKVCPAWALAGSELNDINKRAVESIPNVEQLYVGGLDAVPGEFNIVSMVHVLEHIPNPLEVLTGIRGKLKDDGWLFIEVPDVANNPFDLLVADHSTHFTLRTLRALVERAGFEAVHCTNEWIAKELSIAARKAPAASAPAKTESDAAGVELASANLRWLEGALKRARELESEATQFGLFGTSIAGIWLFGALSGSPKFFVDEDPLRAGKPLLNKPVHAPKDVAAGSTVYVVMPAAIAQRVTGRMKDLRPDVNWQAAPGAA